MLNNMKKLSSQSGFTLVETLIAIFILSMTIGALLSLAAGGFISVRYARNQIVANYLMQESLEYVRNTRDEAFINSVPWSDWIATYTAHDCDKDGCYVDPYAANQALRIEACSGECPAISFYEDEGFYGYQPVTRYSFASAGTVYQTTYVRTVTFRQQSADEIIVTVTMKWLNGTNQKSVSQSILLTNWSQ